MKILLISANEFPACPTGPAYIAGAALSAGHTVRVFDCFPERPFHTRLEHQLRDFDPHVVAISIRVVRGLARRLAEPCAMEPFDIRPTVKEIVACVQRVSNAHIVLGGSGFNYYGADWLEYLDLDYGIRGEADFSFLDYLRRLEEGGDIHTIPGCIFRQDGEIHSVSRELTDNLDGTAYPAYHLFDVEKYIEEEIPLGILTKRGCAFRCTHCPYSSLEGSRYRLKTPKRVVDEIEAVKESVHPAQINFCDNNFNAPRKHAEQICQEIIRRGVDVRWSSQFRPLGFTDEFCQLIKDSGCVMPNITIETASEKMLKAMGRGSKLADIERTLISLDRAGIPFTYTLLFGGPGETPETIAETLDRVDSLPRPATHWITIGILLWTEHQRVVEVARRDGQLDEDTNLFDVPCYLSPELTRDFMLDFIESLGDRENCLCCLFKLP